MFFTSQLTPLQLTVFPIQLVTSVYAESFDSLYVSFISNVEKILIVITQKKSTVKHEPRATVNGFIHTQGNVMNLYLRQNVIENSEMNECQT